MERKRFFEPILLVLLCVSLLVSQQVKAQPRTDLIEIEKIALEELKQTNTPGGAIAIISGDRVIFAKGVGVSNIETGTLITADMLFRTGSAGKMLTAAVLVMLAEEGKFKLDEPIGKYIKGLSPKISQVTAHQLLTHTAGLNDINPSPGSHDEAALAQTVRSWKDNYCFLEPGRIFSYSNPGYALAGLVIEEVSGKAFASVMNELLFKPLGMNRTTFFPWMAMTYPLSQGHIGGKEETEVVRPFQDPAGFRPAGYEFSTVNDMARFAIALVNEGKIEGKQALPSSVIAKLSTPYVATHSHPNPIPIQNGKYGYGLVIHDERGVRIVEHGGVIPGFGCRILTVPEHRFAIVVMTNRTGVMLNRTIEKAMELMLPLKPKTGSIIKQESLISEAEMSKYVGVYDNPLQSRVEIVLKDGKLFFKVSGTELPMTKIGEHRFSIPRPQANEIVFVMATDGKAEFRHTGLRAWKRIETNK